MMMVLSDEARKRPDWRGFPPALHIRRNLATIGLLAPAPTGSREQPVIDRPGPADLNATTDNRIIDETG
ncbi:hypothetical protein ACFL1S_00380 [Pseudomonadota bacterium]